MSERTRASVSIDQTAKKKKRRQWAASIATEGGNPFW